MPMSKLTPETSVLVGALIAIGVVGIETGAVPNLTDLGAAQQHDETVESARRKAAIQATVLVVGVSLVARDLGVYVIGGLVLVGMDYLVKHQNAVNPGTNKLDTEPSERSLYAMPSYENTVDAQ